MQRNKACAKNLGELKMLATKDGFDMATALSPFTVQENNPQGVLPSDSEPMVSPTMTSKCSHLITIQQIHGLTMISRLSDAHAHRAPS
jgi:hypothetical protein